MTQAIIGGTTNNYTYNGDDVRVRKQVGGRPRIMWWI